MNGVTSNDWISTYCARAGAAGSQIAISIRQTRVALEETGWKRSSGMRMGYGYTRVSRVLVFSWSRVCHDHWRPADASHQVPEALSDAASCGRRPGGCDCFGHPGAGAPQSFTRAAPPWSRSGDGSVRARSLRRWGRAPGDGRGPVSYTHLR